MHQGQSARDIFQEGLKRLQPVYDEAEAKAIVYWLMEDLLSLTKTQIALNATGPKERSVYDQALEAVTSGKPVQYVLGYTWFRELKIEVGPGVLIPRPETELAVETVAEWMSGDETVLDIGTGSGCIPIGIARSHPSCTPIGWDLSLAALEMAKRNAERHHVQLQLARVDMLGDWPSISVDAIVSNPPYVLESEQDAMHINVLNHEPGEALFVPDEDPLRYYKALAVKSGVALRPGGIIVLEINEEKSREVAQLLEEAGYQNVEILNDFFDKPRVVKGTQPES